MFALAFILGVAAMGVVGYYRDKGFRAKVQADATVIYNEVSALNTKAKTGVAVVEADFTIVKTKLASLFSKL